jgi:hypothetical protein
MANSAPKTTQIVTGEGRASYLYVFEPKLNELNGKTEYSLSFLIPKSDAQTIGMVRAAANAAIETKWPDAARRPSNLRNPLRDGDIDRPGDAAYEGHYFLNVKSKDQPNIVDANVRPILDARQFVSGDYCRISANAFAYDQKGNRGVSFGLVNIQKTRDGEPLTSMNRKAEADFGVFGNAATPNAGAEAAQGQGYNWD